MQLLFCDTFSQEPADGSVTNSWAAIDFHCPVVLEEIRILPRGCCLHDQLANEGQIGSTSPAHFRIDFFASDPNNDSCSTFENLCTLEYKEASQTSVLPPLPFITDKLVCSGWYQRVTIAVFGAEASDSIAVKAIRGRREYTSRSKGLLPTPSEPSRHPDQSVPYKPEDQPQFSMKVHDKPEVQQIHQPASGSHFQKYDPAVIGSSGGGGGFSGNVPIPPLETKGYRERRQNEFQKNRGYNKRPVALLPTPMADEARDTRQTGYRGGRQQYERYDRASRTSQEWEKEQGGATHDLDRRNSNITDPGESFNQEEGPLFETSQRGDEEWSEEVEYEDISEEEIDEESAVSMEAIMAEDMLLPSTMMNFNPFDMVPYPLSYYKSPELTECEAFRLRILSQIETEGIEQVKASKEVHESGNLQNTINSAKELCFSHLQDKQFATKIIQGKEGDWVSCIEKLIPNLDTSLPCLDLSANNTLHYSSLLVSWAMHCLSLDSPLTKILGVNVRAMKSGLSLALSLAHTTIETSELLVHSGLFDAIFSLLGTAHIASSVKISAVHVLDAVTNWPTIMHSFMFGDGECTNGSKIGYVKVVELALLPQAARVAAAFTQLIKKAHIYECMHQIKLTTQEIVTSKIPVEYAYVSEEESEEVEEIFQVEEVTEMEEVPVVAGYEDVEDTPQPAATAAEDGLYIKHSAGLGDHDNLRIVQQSGHRRVFGESSEPDDNNADATKPFESDIKSPTENSIPLESVFSMQDVTVTEDELLKLAKSLDEITRAFQSPSTAIGQLSIKAFPGRYSKPLAYKPELCDVTLFRMSEFAALLPSVQALMTLPFVSGFKPLFDSCCGFLEQLMSDKNQLLHISTNSDSLMHAVHHLLKSSPSLDVDTTGTPGNVGLKLAIHIQCIQSLDHIASLLDQEDSAEVEDELNHAFRILYSITYLPLGKHCLARIFSMGEYLKPILSCIWYPGKISDFNPESVATAKAPNPTVKEAEDQKSESDSKTVESSDKNEEEKIETTHHRSAVNHYAAAMFLNTIIKSESTSYIFQHMTDIQKSCLTECHSIPKCGALKNWLNPLTCGLSGDVTDIGKLLGYIKMQCEPLEWKTFQEIGPKLCTALRLLCHVCEIGTKTSTSLGQRLSMMQMFSSDGLNVTITCLEKLHTCLGQICHGIRAMSIGFPQTLFSAVASIAQNSLKLLHLMLDQLLEAGIDSKCVNGERLIKALVSLYSDLYILIRPLDPLLLYDVTQLFVGVCSLFFKHEACFDQSNTIFTELLKYAESQCDNFVSTLTLVSQLLPLPLPIISPEGSTEGTDAPVLATSSMWSSCILPHIDRLMSLLIPLSASMCRPLLNVSIALTQQIIDTSPTLAHEVVRKFLEEVAPLLVNTAIPDDEAMETNGEQNGNDKELMLSPEQITTIAVFSEIATLPAAKAAVISALYNEGDGILDLWQHAASDSCQVDAVAAILLLSSVLVDSEIALLPPCEGDAKSLSNHLPSTLHLRQITCLAIRHLLSSSEVVISRALLVILRIVDQRLAFPFIRNEFSKNDGHLLKCIETLNKKFDPKNWQSVEAALNLIEVLAYIIEPEITEIEDIDSSRPCLTISQVSNLLRWNDDPQHPLRVFEGKVNQLCDLESFGCDSTLDKLAVFRQQLRKDVFNAGEIIIVQEPDFPAPMLLADQFAARAIFVSGDDDCILTKRLALICPGFCPAGAEPATGEFVQCDLVATADKFCPGYDLKEQVSRLAESADFVCEALDSDAETSTRQPKVETFTSRGGKKFTYMKRSHGLFTHQPRVGRGRGNIHNRPFDLFRHRKQNTSRPPSMHVDDFMAADEEHMRQQKGDVSVFKSPQPPLSQQLPNRRQIPQAFKRDFVPKNRGGRGMRGVQRFPRGGGGFSYNNQAQSKFRPKVFSPIRGRSQERYRGSATTTQLTSRLSYSPREGYKTNKTENQSWNFSNRSFSQGSSGVGNQFRGRGARFQKHSRGRPTSPFGSSRGGTKPWQQNLGLPRSRGRGYGAKPRGKHIRSFTR